ncbi:hypothetical protein V2P20_04025 [Methylobacter sp. Wu1]
MRIDSHCAPENPPPVQESPQTPDRAEHAGFDRHAQTRDFVDADRVLGL